MAVLEIEAGARRRLPIWQTAKGAYRDTFANIPALAIAGALPCLMSILLDFAVADEADELPLQVLRLTITSVIGGLFECVWLRTLLLESSDAPARPLPPLNLRFARYIGYGLLFTFPFGLMMVLRQVTGGTPTQHALALALGATFAITYVILIFLYLRLSFVFCWIVTDFRATLMDSWRCTRGNGVRLLVAYLLVSMPLLALPFAFGIIIAMISPDFAQQFGSGTLEQDTRWYLLIGGNIGVYLYYGVEAAFGARAFCTLTGWQSDRRELLERFE